MAAKKLIIASLIVTLLAGCGSTANQPALPGDGTYGDTVLPADDFDAAPMGPAPYDPGPASGQPPASGAAGVDGQIGDPNSPGFTLRGLVTDQAGKPVPGAKVSIGSQTTLTTDKGDFVITGISDTQVWVDVTANGFDPITRFNVAFSADKATADKEFKLAPAGSGGGTTQPTGPRLTPEGTFSGPAFKSVVALAADGNRIYVLGKIDKAFWFDRMAVVVYDAASGAEISRVGDRLFSQVPKAATSLAVQSGNLVVSDGKERVTFDASGGFVKKAAGAGFEVVTQVEDPKRNLTFALKAGGKVLVNGKDLEATLALENVASPKALALDAEGGLIVLDAGENLVHRFSFER